MIANHWTAREWAEQAGLTRSHVSGLGQKNSRGKVAYETFRKLAQAAGVSIVWLAEGIGSCEDPFIEGSRPANDDAIEDVELGDYGEEDEWSDKQRALEAGRLLGFSAAALARVAVMPEGERCEYYFLAAVAEHLKRPRPPPRKSRISRP